MNWNDLTTEAPKEDWGALADPVDAKPSKMRRYVADPTISLLKGVIGVPEAAVGLADIPTGGRVGKFAEDIGFRPKEAKQFLDTLLSPEQQEANKRVAEADGFFGTLGEAITNPSTIAHTVLESAPSMLGGGAVARGLMKVAPKVSPLAAGALGEGAVSAGQTAEQIRQATPTGTLNPTQGAIAAGSGALTAGLGAAGGATARKMGLTDIDTLIAGGRTAAGKAGLARRVGGGALSEGVLEELPQSFQEQVAQNIALGKPAMEKAPEAAAMGMLAGAAMGGGAGFISGPTKAQAPIVGTGNPVSDSPVVSTMEIKQDGKTHRKTTHRDGSIDVDGIQVVAPKQDVSDPITEAKEKAQTDPKGAAEDLLKVATEDVVTGEDRLGVTKPAAGEATVTQPVNDASASGVPVTWYVVKGEREEREENTRDLAVLRKVAGTPQQKGILTDEERQYLVDRGLARVNSSGGVTVIPIGRRRYVELEAQERARIAQEPTSTGTAEGAVEQPGAQPALTTQAAPTETEEQQKAAPAAEQEGTGPAQAAPQATAQQILENRAPNDVPGSAVQKAATAAVELTAPRVESTAQGDGTRESPVQVAISADVERAAAVASKDHTPPQGEANNVQRGHVEWQDLEGTIEVPSGGTRKGTNPKTGEPWQTTHTRPYGYWKGTKDADGMHVDVIWGPELDKGHPVYVLDEIDEQGGFRQHKTLPGFPSEQAAREAYLGISSKKPEHVGAITAMPVEQFKEWLKGDTTKPVAYSPTKPSQEPAASERKSKARKPADRRFARIREHYTPGNIVFSGYWRDHDRVLAFEEKNGDWRVQVEQVKKEGDKWVPSDKPRWHSTAPDANDRIVERAKPAELDKETKTPREPWQMTSAEYVESFKGQRIKKTGFQNRLGTLQNAHRDAVDTALQLGKNVPPEVRAEYPEIESKYAGLQTNTEESTPDEPAAAATPTEESKAAPQPEVAPSEPLELTAPTPAELAARAAQQAAEAARVAAESVKAMADEMRAGFKLTGSQSQRDEGAAAGQGDMLEKGDQKAQEGKITDVGENLWYNRRNFTGKALTWEDAKNLNDALKVKEVVKAKVWPKPNYEQLVEQGMEPFIARMLKQVYDGIATAPAGKYDADLQRYIDVIGRVRDAVLDWARDNNSNREFLNKLAAAAQVQVGAMRGTPTALTALAGSDTDFRDVILDRVWPLAESEQRTRRYRFSGNEERTAEARAIGGNRAIQAMQFTLDDAVTAMKDVAKGWPTPREAWQRQGYTVVKGEGVTARFYEGKRTRDESPYVSITWHLPGLRSYVMQQTVHGAGGEKTLTKDDEIVQQVAKSETDKMNAGWLLLDKRGEVVKVTASEETAKEAAREITKREGNGGEIRGMNIAEAERSGPERRKDGENVSSERLKSEFGFRGVNFGREGWINQTERQAYLNHAYDALYDLAELLDVPPKALSLNGMLGIAFGAQGRGGKAAAHFVPGVNEINLTKTMGAGTLAHEWGHALDHYFATQGGLAKSSEPFMSEHATLGETRAKTDQYGRKIGTEQRFGEVRPEIVAAFKAVTETMEKRPLTEAEYKAQQTASRNGSLRRLEDWIQHFRKDIEKTKTSDEALTLFDQAAERLRKGDIGERYTKVRGQTLPQFVGAIKIVVRDYTNGSSVDRAENYKSLASNAEHVAYILDEKRATDTHVPQTTSTTYAGESSYKDQQKGGKAYWRTRTEMFARAFETWVSDKLVERTQENTFLSDAVKRAEHIDPSTGKHSQPYPRGDDRTRINEAMGKLVDAIETKETDRGVAMFSREGSNTGIPLRDAHAVVSQVRRVLRGAPPIHVLDDVKKSPKGLLSAIKAEGAMNDVEAAFYEGEIFVFPQHIGSVERAQFVIGHHEIRHYGLRGMLGPDAAPIFLNIYGSNPDVKAAADAKGGSRVTAVEEVLADMPTEEVAKLKGIDRLIAAIRNFLRGLSNRMRSVGLSSLADAVEPTEWTDGDVLYLVSRAESMARQGGTPFRAGGTAFGQNTAVGHNWTVEEAQRQGYTLKAYRGVDRANPFNDSGTVWATTNRDVAEAYTRDVWGYTDPDVVEVWINPKDIPQHDASRLTDEQRVEFGADEFGNPQAIGIYRKSDDSPLGSNYPHTAIHVPAANVWVLGQGIVGGRAAFSRAAWIDQQPAETQEALRKAGVWYTPPTLKDRVQEWRGTWAKRLRQGVVDQFDAIKEYDYKAYMLARMTKGADAALEAVLNYGTIKLDADGAVDVNFERGGFLGILQSLKGEHERFLAWVIGNRAERLLAEGREHNFTPEDVQRLKGLNQGQMEDGSSRAQLYARVRADLDRYNKSVLDIAERAGLIDGSSRATWEKDFYVPFYRLMEEEGTKGPIPTKGLVNQYAFKVLKGGEQALGDPLENVLRNWSHLIDASLKNQAARESLLAAERMGAVIEADEATARQIAKAMDNKRGAVSFVDQGVQRWFVVEDPFLLDALKSIGFMGFQGPAMKALQKFKKWLTLGVTVSPTFRIRNVIRDSLSMIGTNPASYNVLDNVLTGWKATKEGTPEYASLLAGGGVMRFGTLLEGDRASHVKQLIESGVDAQTILNTPQKARAMLRAAWDWWQHVGDRAENVNRAALYKKLRAEGMSHLEASFRARDVMDFSMQGTFAAVRFLVQTVPFMNARLQGLYKLGRGAAEDPRRFGVVLGATTMATIALMLAYQDDDDWKQREDWDRESFWWFKIGGTAYRIPKPFEIGAIASIAERGLEAMISDELTGKQFAERVYAIVSENLSMNPVPQMLKPIIEVYANRDSFTDRPIETMGMEKLSPAQRSGPGTSATARLLGKNGFVSPVQIDHLVRGYFGWLGSHIVSTADLALRPAMGLPPEPAWKIDQVLVAGDFAKDLPAYQSKYVTRLYDQMKEVQEAMADLRHLQKIGATEKARELLEEKGDKIRLYRLYTHAEKQLSNVNRQIKMAQMRGGSAEEKRERLDALYAARNRIARVTEEAARKRLQ